MSKAIGLQDYAAELAHAAGAGAARIASSVTASGNVQAETGVAVQLPGPALRSALARVQGRSRRASNAVSSDQVPKIATRMAHSALRQGADLLRGERS